MVLQRDQPVSTFVQADFRKEIELLRSCQHQNIVGFKAACLDAPNHPLMVMELAEVWPHQQATRVCQRCLTAAVGACQPLDQPRPLCCLRRPCSQQLKHALLPCLQSRWSPVDKPVSCNAGRQPAAGA